jgi:hypothetical protein
MSADYDKPHIFVKGTGSGLWPKAMPKCIIAPILKGGELPSQSFKERDLRRTLRLPKDMKVIYVGIPARRTHTFGHIARSTGLIKTTWASGIKILDYLDIPEPKDAPQLVKISKDGDPCWQIPLGFKFENLELLISPKSINSSALFIARGGVITHLPTIFSMSKKRFLEALSSGMQLPSGITHGNFRVVSSGEGASLEYLPEEKKTMVSIPNFLGFEE